jgi:hypothetical protein
MALGDMKVSDVIRDATEKAFRDMVQAIVNKMFEDRWGYRDGEKVQEALKAEVAKMLATDPDLRGRIKKRLVDLIDKGVAYDRD